MIQLKDVIYYYIGVKCYNTWFPPDHEAYNAEWMLQGYRATNIKPYLLENETDTTWTDSIKPILRRTEDITDEEIKEFIGWDKLNKLYIDVKYEKVFNGIEVSYSIDAGDQGIYPMNQFQTLDVFTPNEFRCLISKSFDLFGLIDSGQAIDAKTIS